MKIKRLYNPIQKIEEFMYSNVLKKFENKFSIETTKNLFIGIVSGFVVSCYLIIRDLFKEIFGLLELFFSKYIIIVVILKIITIIIDILFLIIFAVVIRKFSKYFLKK